MNQMRFMVVALAVACALICALVAAGLQMASTHDKIQAVQTGGCAFVGAITVAFLIVTYLQSP
ncbi:hypothetical protein AB0P17_36970 [Streptomyces sp. NPDC088124]|uniref:hypothetical protein n=1 Tax=Streptomyces sp. NPDC088124 TaxID=3154654 RepID=UPI00343D52F1